MTDEELQAVQREINKFVNEFRSARRPLSDGPSRELALQGAIGRLLEDHPELELVVVPPPTTVVVESLYLVKERNAVDRLGDLARRSWS